MRIKRINKKITSSETRACAGNKQKQPLEVFCRKEVLLEISQNSQVNNCARDSFIIKLQVSGLQLY